MKHSKTRLLALGTGLSLCLFNTALAQANAPETTAVELPPDTSLKIGAVQIRTPLDYTALGEAEAGRLDVTPQRILAEYNDLLHTEEGQFTKHWMALSRRGAVMVTANQHDGYGVDDKMRILTRVGIAALRARDTATASLIADEIFNALEKTGFLPLDGEAEVTALLYQLAGRQLPKRLRELSDPTFLGLSNSRRR